MKIIYNVWLTLISLCCLVASTQAVPTPHIPPIPTVDPCLNGHMQTVFLGNPDGDPTLPNLHYKICWDMVASHISGTPTYLPTQTGQFNQGNLYTSYGFHINGTKRQSVEIRVWGPIDSVYMGDCSPSPPCPNGWLHGWLVSQYNVPSLPWTYYAQGIAGNTHGGPGNCLSFTDIPSPSLGPNYFATESNVRTWVLYGVSTFSATDTQALINSLHVTKYP
jgi:hypothetical protein